MSGEVAVLVDFGLVRALTKEAPPAPGVGTVSYMAPEVMNQGTYTPESDRYALGCVAYYMLTGEDPPADADAAIMRSKLAKVPALGANPSLLNHLMTMLDPDPSARPQRATSWVQLFRSSTLTEAGGRAGLPPIKPPERSTVPMEVASVPPPRRRRTPAWLALALVVALLGGGAAYAALRETGGGTPLAAKGGTTTTDAPVTTATTVLASTTSAPPTTRSVTTTVPTATSTSLSAGAGAATGGNVFLVDLPYDGYRGTGSIQVKGEALIRSVYLSPQTNSLAQVTYALGGRYQRLEARLGLADTTRTNLRVRFQIFGDAPNPLFDRVIGKGEIVPVDVQLNRTGRLQLVAIVDQDPGGYDHYSVFGEARVIP